MCGNPKLERFIADQLSGEHRASYAKTMAAVRNITATDAQEVVLKENRLSDPSQQPQLARNAGWVGVALGLALFVLLILLLRRKRQNA